MCKSIRGVECNNLNGILEEKYHLHQNEILAEEKTANPTLN